MVKLIKHELFALFRVLIFIAAASLLFAAAGRITFAVSSVENEVLSTLFGIFYGAASLMLLFAAWFMGVVRFYNTLFTGEGYLTLSLPISSAKLVLGKLLSAIIAILFSFAVCALSCVILSAGDDYLPFNIFYDIFVMIGEGVAEQPVRGVELALLVLTGLPLGTLLLYAVLSVGQLLSSHRKLFIFGLLVAVYILLQILLTYCAEPIFTATDAVSEHLTVSILIAVFAAIDVGSFFFVRYILANKVNLL